VEDLLGKSDHDVFPREQADIYWAHDDMVFEKGTVDLNEEPQTIRGELHTIATKKSLYRDSISGKKYIVATIRDITQQKRIEEALRQREAFIKNVIDSMNDGVFVINPDFQITMWNPAMERISKQPKANVLYKDEPLWEILPYLKKAGADSIMKLAMRGVKTLNIEAPYRLPGGTRGITSNSYFPLKNPAGKIMGVIGVVRDITERKEAEKALRESEEQLRQAQKMESIGRLAGGIAHDFNNLLTVISGNIELILAEEKPSERQNTRLADVRKTVEHAASLTHQLLAFSRKQLITPKVHQINELLINFEKMLVRVIGEDVDLAFHLEEGLWPVSIDRGQFEQLLFNLSVNARDAMPHGGKLVIETENHVIEEEKGDSSGDVPPGSYARISVSDNGIGMDSQTLSMIFEPFFTTKEKGKGTGLGLSTCYGIVKQHNGFVRVHSETDEGTRFELFFPRSYENLEEEQQTMATGQQMLTARCFLLVEDDPMVRTIIKEMLKSDGFVVYDFGSGREALNWLENGDTPIDLLITDVVMPNMNGKQLAEQVQRYDSSVRVLYISGYTDEMIAKHGVLDAGTAFIQKPFKRNVLLGKIREILE
jgi:two-component system cell cycle sensor histidine kinase/response regulator CckA